MRFATALAAAVSLPLIASAAPLTVKRVSDTDLLVLKFADVLEQLETQFYAAALQKFNNQDFIDAGYTVTQVPIDLLTTIQQDEAAHTSFLDGALGNQAVQGCQFNFNPVLTDVATTMAAARLVELVGVGAYIGGGAILQDKSLLAAAAGILTIEARHQSELNTLNGQSAIPAAFEFGLTPPQVLSIAGPFISGCDLGIQANLPVNVRAVPQPGQLVQFDTTGLPNNAQLFCQMILAGQPAASVILPINQCAVPANLPDGPVLLFITNSQVPLANNVVTQDANAIVAGPAIVFIDQNNDSLANLVLQNGQLLSAGQRGLNNNNQFNNGINNGLNQNGFNNGLNGLNQNGINNGLNQNGFNQNGINNGLNQNGFNQNGLNQNGLNGLNNGLQNGVNNGFNNGINNGLNGLNGINGNSINGLNDVLDENGDGKVLGIIIVDNNGNPSGL